MGKCIFEGCAHFANYQGWNIERIRGVASRLSQGAEPYLDFFLEYLYNFIRVH